MADEEMTKNVGEDTTKSVKNEIIGYIEKNGVVTLEDIVFECEISKSEVTHQLEQLIKERIVRKFFTSRGTYFMLEWTRFADNTLSLSNPTPAIIDVYKACDDCLDLKDELKKIYANFISLMGIFVAIFSFVVVNVSFTPQLCSEGITMKAIEKIAVINLSIVFCLACLVYLIKVVIIKSLCKK